ncbi:hypothetical protein M422DRAFT_259119 [Sphaerobolus stellatus SS14]|uniref:Uncharacterized protein n=1 Tax=Sphaerobolus stellatus (strain SS14) TaxID=990650 RepID=A0A0C9VKE4_SPHS4|nr:hypothetical protein M422DRAFT_259119 [Sphaerobolus stellatus SS14]
MSKIQYFRATPHTMYHPLVSNKTLRLGSCSLVKLEYHGREQSNFMGIEPGSILRFPNMTEMHLTKIRMDVPNWEFLDRIEKETDEIVPFLLRDMTPCLFSIVTSLVMEHFIIDRAGLKTIMKARPWLGYLILQYFQVGLSEGNSDANDRLFGANMIHVSVEYCGFFAHTLRALLLNIFLHRARHTGNVSCKLALYLALRSASDRRSERMPEVLESSEFQDVLFTTHDTL